MCLVLRKSLMEGCMNDVPNRVVDCKQPDREIYVHIDRLTSSIQTPPYNKHQNTPLQQSSEHPLTIGCKAS
nr:hypothetical protein [Tanacetum cinerariifolium]